MVDVWGAQGGGSSVFGGGLGAGVGVDVALTAGEEVLVIVGAQGGYGSTAGGGGGSSAALLAPGPFGGLVAGGGGGGSVFGAGGNGVAPAVGGPGPRATGAAAAEVLLGVPANTRLWAHPAVGFSYLLATARVRATWPEARVGSGIGPAGPAALVFRAAAAAIMAAAAAESAAAAAAPTVMAAVAAALQFRRADTVVGLPVR